MNQIGIITRIENKRAIVSVKRTTACGENCAGCSAACNVKAIEVKADLIDDVSVGDQVEIFSEDISVLKYALVLYGLPLVLMLACIFVVYYFNPTEQGQLIGLLVGFASLIISFFLLRLYEKKELKKRSFDYKIVKKIEF